MFKSARVFNGVRGAVRYASSQAGRQARTRLVGPVASAAAVSSLAAGSYLLWKHRERLFSLEDGGLAASAQCAVTHAPSQRSVFSETKSHAVYLTIHLKPTANVRECARVLADLPKMVDEVCPPNMTDEEDEVLAGVGFGENFLGQMNARPKFTYAYPHRKGQLGEMPSTGGDIFIHAKSNETSKLFELVQLIFSRLPKDSVDKFEDVYGFVYKNGRDLSGFIDGTENPADEDSRREVAVDKMTGGSYVITQRWIHLLDVIGSEKDRTMEGWVGRSRSDSTEISRKSITSHVARMTGGNAFNQQKKHEIVRQSQPYGNLSGDAGLFFIAYSASPERFEFMLDRMVGSGGDGHSDDVMRLSRCVTGTYWYFPGEAELKRMK